MHETAVRFALRHKLGLGRDHLGYYLRRDGVIVDRPYEAGNARRAQGALAMMRRHLRRLATEASR